MRAIFKKASKPPSRDILTSPRGDHSLLETSTLISSNHLCRPPVNPAGATLRQCVRLLFEELHNHLRSGSRTSLIRAHLKYRFKTVAIVKNIFSGFETPNIELFYKSFEIKNTNLKCFAINFYMSIYKQCFFMFFATQTNVLRPLHLARSGHREAIFLKRASQNKILFVRIILYAHAWLIQT